MPPVSTALTLTGKRNFYGKLIIELLTKMEFGRLNLTLPSGECLQFGNGSGSITANIHVRNNSFFQRCVLFGDIGFGEAYVDGDWHTDNITNVIRWFLLNVDNAPSVSGSKAKSAILNVLKFFNRISHIKRANSLNGSKKNIAEHYDLNNDFFALFLDPTMTYSSAYFKEEGMDLAEAQLAKYERLCRQLHLQRADHVLEIGSGWGGNAIYMAKYYGCTVTTVTISEEQFKMAKQRIAEEGLQNKITVLLQDYRNIQGSYDKIVSIEMLEAVGAGFLDVYFKKCNEVLKKNGILAFQVITCPDARFNNLKHGVDWIQKHIFPGSLLPSVAALNKAINNTSDLTLVDLKDIGLDYAKTLGIWREQFNANITKVKNLGFNDQFIRKWNYYLSYCEAAFAMRNINVMQMVYTRPNNILR
ncbi:MAG TPA: cyclopropane-fatty-acyl-phospholipid synthase family protein [Chitinophagaceae bacterium]|nr:cyclopropane-fatty-acyl-phospholipid synthase family protein [Chitinophagaceae bacterium]